MNSEGRRELCGENIDKIGVRCNGKVSDLLIYRRLILKRRNLAGSLRWNKNANQGRILQKKP